MWGKLPYHRTQHLLGVSQELFLDGPQVEVLVAMLCVLIDPHNTEYKRAGVCPHLYTAIFDHANAYQCLVWYSLSGSVSYLFTIFSENAKCAK